MLAGKSDLVGRYMLAKRDIAPGEVIFTDQPAVIGKTGMFEDPQRLTVALDPCL